MELLVDDQLVAHRLYGILENKEQQSNEKVKKKERQLSRSTVIFVLVLHYDSMSLLRQF